MDGMVGWLKKKGGGESVREVHKWRRSRKDASKSAGTPTHHILLPRCHKHKVLCFMGKGCLEVLPHNALPRRPKLLVALPLDNGAHLTVLLGAADARKGREGNRVGGGGRADRGADKGRGEIKVCGVVSKTTLSARAEGSISKRRAQRVS